MSTRARAGLFALVAACCCRFAAGQAALPPLDPVPPAVDASGPSAIDLNWAPPALAALASQAAVQNSFTFDRNLLAAAASLLPQSDADVRQTVNKLEGLSVHLLRFGADGVPDQAAVDALRAAYHQAGWKHLAGTSASHEAASDNSTDVWLRVDGVKVRGAVVLQETPRSLTLVTVAGNLNPVDLLHLRGHFGIPRFNDDALGKPAQQ